MWKWIKRAICEKMCGSLETGSTHSSGTLSPPSPSETNGDPTVQVPIALSTTGPRGACRFLTGQASISVVKEGGSDVLTFTHSFQRDEFESLARPYGDLGPIDSAGLDLKLTIPLWVLTTTSPNT